MKAVWYGITGLLAAFAAVIAWYSYDRMQSSQTLPAKPDVSVAKKILPTPPKPEPKPKPKAEAPAAPEPAPAVKKPQEPQAAAKTETATRTPPAKTKAKAPEPEAPSFDVVRVEPDGSAVIAGRAQPGWKIIIRSKGVIIGEATANSRGEWVIISDKPVAAGTSSLKLTAISPDNTVTLASSQIVAISRPAATMKPPAKVAEAKLPEAKAPVPASEPAPAAVTPEDKKNAETGEPAAKEPAQAATKMADAGMKKPDTPAAETDVAAKPATPATDTAEAKMPVRTKAGEPVAKPGAKPVAEPADKAKIKTAEAAPQKPVAQNLKAGVPVSPEPEKPAAGAPADAPAETAEAAVQKPAKQTPETSAPVNLEPEKPVAEPAPGAAAKTTGAGTEKPAVQAADKKAPVKKMPEVSAAPVQKKAPEPAKPLIVVSEPGKASRVLQTPVDAPAENLIPLSFRSVDYNDDGQVILSGRAKKGSSLRIYLNNDFIGTATANADGNWELKTRTHIQPGQYTLRVDQIGRGNKITSRVEAPFERAAPEAVKQARINGEVIIQPGDNLWNISRALYGHGIQYTVIYEANKNKIRDPDLIYPGQIFTTPGSNASVPRN